LYISVARSDPDPWAKATDAQMKKNVMKRLLLLWHGENNEDSDFMTVYLWDSIPWDGVPFLTNLTKPFQLCSRKKL